MMQQLTKEKSSPVANGFFAAVVSLAILLTTLAFAANAASVGAGDTQPVRERYIAQSLAQSQHEYIKSQPYLDAPASYDIIPLPSPEFAITAEALPMPGADDNMQRIMVTVYHNGYALLTVEDRKVRR